jgi:hypothetical protein
MVTYQDVYAELIIPAVMLINHKLKTAYQLQGGIIQALGVDTTVGGVRYFIDVLVTGNVLLRIYYYNDADSHISVVQQEQYLTNNANVSAMYILHQSYNVRTIKRNVDVLLKALIAEGAEYQYFNQNNFMLSLFSGIYILVDHFNNRIVDDQGNFIIL